MPSPSIRWNVLANFGGQGWRAVMALVFVPFYLRILGVEAYGLIGLYTSLQMGLALLDAGLRPTLAREMARFTGAGLDATGIRTLLRSVELPMIALAAVIVFGMAAAAPWLAHHWVHPQHLSDDVVSRSFTVMGLVAAAQFIESLYDSCLSGLQRQVLQNAIITVMATLRGCGALVVILIVPSVAAFFLWQAIVAVVSLVTLGSAVYRALPKAHGPVRFSVAELRRIRGYALGIFGISVLSFLLTQSDRVVLAKFLPLADVGVYTLGATLAGVLALVGGPFGNAFYPRLTELHARGEHHKMVETFHFLTRIFAVLVGAAAAMLVFFGGAILNLWVHNPAVTERAAPVTAFLALGGLFNSLTATVYMIQLAHGVTRYTLRINSVMLVFYITALVLAVEHFGAVGAAACAALLNLAGMTASATMTFANLLPGEARNWWLGDVTKQLGIVFSAGLVLRLLLPRPEGFLVEAMLLASAGGAILLSGILADPALRKLVLQACRILPLQSSGNAR